MAIKTFQNFYKTTLTVATTSAVGNIYVSILPTQTTGYLVINPKDSTKREIIEFNAIGTDGGGNYVYANTRGVGGTTAQIHEIGEAIRMNLTAEHWAELLRKDTVDDTFDANTKRIKNVVNPTNNQDACTKLYVDNLAIAGAPDASAITKGISKLSVAPVSPTNPIAVGDNDTRIPTQDENNALVGTNGLPSSTNKYVTASDTTLLGAEQTSNKDTTTTLGTSNIKYPSQNAVKVYADGKEGAIASVGNAIIDAVGHQVTKDSIIYGYGGRPIEAGASIASIICYSDAVSNPTTVVQKFVGTGVQAGHYGNYSFFVKAGHYYKISAYYGTGGDGAGFIISFT